MLSLSPTNVILIITKRVFFGTDSGGPLAYEGTKSRLGKPGPERVLIDPKLRAFSRGASERGR